jgi:anaerobic selenocysteine-containing dehydrogenase
MDGPGSAVHPVGFHWPMKAKEKDATRFHDDPRFTRMSAVCDVFVGIRSGSDVAFLGGLVNYVLTNVRLPGVRLHTGGVSAGGVPAEVVFRTKLQLAAEMESACTRVPRAHAARKMAPEAPAGAFAEDWIEQCTVLRGRRR